MKTKLITALRACAVALENGTFAYDWYEKESCNCGILASAVTGLSLSKLSKELPHDSGPYWRDMIGDHCPVTGVPTHRIFRQLHDVGLSALDLVQLEDLSNPRVLARMPKFEETKTVKAGFFGKEKKTRIEVPPKNDSKICVIAYMRAWADILVEDGKLDSPETPDNSRQEAESIST